MAMASMPVAADLRDQRYVYRLSGLPIRSHARDTQMALDQVRIPRGDIRLIATTHGPSFATGATALTRRQDPLPRPVASGARAQARRALPGASSERTCSRLLLQLRLCRGQP